MHISLHRRCGNQAADLLRLVRSRKSGLRGAGCLVVLCLLVLPAALDGQAYRVRPLQQPKSDVVLFGAVSVSASPGSLNFALTPHSVAQASTPVEITTTWELVGIAPSLDLYAYFGSPAAALSDERTPPDNIPASAVLGQMTTGVPVTFTPFTEAIPESTAGLVLLRGAAASNFFGSRTDALRLEINLADLPALPAGSYNGTLTLKATIM
jgi:hypothetical protein